jgi:hypothetical protein
MIVEFKRDKIKDGIKKIVSSNQKIINSYGIPVIFIALIYFFYALVLFLIGLRIVNDAI